VLVAAAQAALRRLEAAEDALQGAGTWHGDGGPALRSAIVDVSRTFGVLSRHTAFYAEQVAVAGQGQHGDAVPPPVAEEGPAAVPEAPAYGNEEYASGGDAASADGSFVRAIVPGPPLAAGASASAAPAQGYAAPAVMAAPAHDAAAPHAVPLGSSQRNAPALPVALSADTIAAQFAAPAAANARGGHPAAAQRAAARVAARAAARGVFPDYKGHAANAASLPTYARSRRDGAQPASTAAASGGGFTFYGLVRSGAADPAAVGMLAAAACLLAAAAATLAGAGSRGEDDEDDGDSIAACSHAVPAEGSGTAAA
jgi:hypothetical protein